MSDAQRTIEFAILAAIAETTNSSVEETVAAIREKLFDENIRWAVVVYLAECSEG